jgi:hypothetical protein
MIKGPSFPEPPEYRVSFPPVYTERGEVKLQPEEEVQEHGFAIRRYFTDEVHSAVVPRLGHRGELLHDVLPP